MTFELAAHPLPSVANGEVAEYISDELPVLGGRALPPDPLLESAPPVGAPCAKQSPVCFCFVRWHFTSVRSDLDNLVLD